MFSQRAFTLVELVMAIAITGIVAGISTQFIRSSTVGAIDTAARQQLSATSAIINEKITRALRSALPGSIRVTTDSRCIEYMPISAASTYTNLVTGSPITTFNAVPYRTSGPNVSGHISVFPLASNNLYALSNPGALTAGTSTVNTSNNEIQVTVASHQFTNDSPVQRFYVSQPPQAICQQGNYLYRYGSYGFISNVNALQAGLPTTFAAGREVLAFPLVANSMVFRVVPATLQRNGVATFRYQLQNMRNDETLQLAQEVHIRNVP